MGGRDGIAWVRKKTILLAIYAIITVNSNLDDLEHRCPPRPCYDLPVPGWRRVLPVTRDCPC